MNRYTVGTLVQLSVTFTNQATNQPADPSTTACKVKAPNGVISDVSVTIQRTAAGIYTATFLPAMKGEHEYEWIGTGSVQASVKNRFLVTEDLF